MSLIDELSARRRKHAIALVAVIVLGFVILALLIAGRTLPVYASIFHTLAVLAFLAWAATLFWRQGIANSLPCAGLHRHRTVSEDVASALMNCAACFVFYSMFTYLADGSLTGDVVVVPIVHGIVLFGLARYRALRSPPQ